MTSNNTPDFISAPNLSGVAPTPKTPTPRESGLDKSGAPAPKAPPQVNVANWERGASVAVGVGLAALALHQLTRRGSAWKYLGAASLLAAGSGLLRRGAKGHCGLYESLGVNTADRPATRGSSVPSESGARIEKTITIARSAEDLFAFWRNLENLPRFMSHLKSVTDLGGGRSHWVAQAPAGLNVEWDAEIINEHADQMIAWRSLENSELANAGSVRFREVAASGAPIHTEIKVSLKYDPPGGQLGVAVAKFLGQDPEKQIEEDLGRLKYILENEASAAS